MRFQCFESLTKVVEAIHVRILRWLVHSGPTFNGTSKKKAHTDPHSVWRLSVCAVSVGVYSSARSGSAQWGYVSLCGSAVGQLGWIASYAGIEWASTCLI